MPDYRIRDAAALLGVSDDTVRRWVDAGRLPAGRDDAGRRVVDGVALAAFAQELAARPDGEAGRHSVRNRFTGLVTRVVRDTVMAQVEIQAGPFRVVSLISREAADELGLEPGVLATATAKATTVAVERPTPHDLPSARATSAAGTAGERRSADAASPADGERAGSAAGRTGVDDGARTPHAPDADDADADDDPADA